MIIKLHLPKNLDQLDKIVINAFKETQKTVVLEGDRILASSLRDNVYSYVPRTNEYRRTGRLLKGRKSQIVQKGINFEVNPKFAGANRNYANLVNQQKFRKGRFFDIATKELSELAQRVFKNNINKYVNKK